MITTFAKHNYYCYYNYNIAEIHEYTNLKNLIVILFKQKAANTNLVEQLSQTKSG